MVPGDTVWATRDTRLYDEEGEKRTFPEGTLGIVISAELGYRPRIMVDGFVGMSYVGGAWGYVVP